MFDGSDHKVKPSSEDAGPDLCFIVDFHKDVHGTYSKLESFQNLKVELTQLAVSWGSGWESFDHLGSKAPKKNLYHPLHLRIPFSEFLDGTTKFEEQVDAIYGVLSKCLEALLGIKDKPIVPAFLKLRADFESDRAKLQSVA